MSTTTTTEPISSIIAENALGAMLTTINARWTTISRYQREMVGMASCARPQRRRCSGTG